MSRILILAALAFGSASAPALAAAPRVCLDAAETRAAIAEHKFTSPALAQKSAARQAGGGEFLRSRLCRWNEEYIYEISLLLRDGKIARIDVSAVDGHIADKPGE